MNTTFEVRLMILKLFLALNIITLFQPFISQESSLHHPNPKLKVYIHIFQKKELGCGFQKEQRILTFHVEAENTETILFWLIPTGTQTWTERKLIGYDIRENQTDNHFSLTWNIDKPYLLDHLYIQAIGDEIVEQDEINLYME